MGAERRALWNVANVKVVPVSISNVVVNLEL